MSCDIIWLRKRGWRLIGKGPRKYGTPNMWDHPDHQPDFHGAFFQSAAIAHQKLADKYGCNCIKSTEGGSRLCTTRTEEKHGTVTK